MRKLNLFKYGLTAMMMAFAMTLCFSCSSDDDEEVPEEKKETKEEEKEKDKEKDKEKENPSSKADGTVDGHDYVIVAGIKWATENVGAVDGIESSGSSDIKSYTWDNAKKATESWGDNWTLPTQKQWERLLDECDWTWKKNYSFCGKTLNGFIVTEKFDTTKFVFLPTGRGGAADWDVYSATSGKQIEIDHDVIDHEAKLYVHVYDSVSQGYSKLMLVRPVVVGSFNEVIPPSKVDGNINGHDYVELAGIKWATTNVGRVNGVEAYGMDVIYGYYYEYDPNGVRNAAKAATSWGDKWELPTTEQWQKLIDECDRKWVNGYSYGGKTMNGCIFADRNDHSKYIFLPAAGIMAMSASGVPNYFEKGINGEYWCNSVGYSFKFYDAGRKKDCTFSGARSVRPVIVDIGEIPSLKVDGEINGHAYVELAGIKWATENVGKVDDLTPQKTDATYGYYYSHGDTKKAAESWGGTWTSPSTDQWEKLMSECDSKWVRGYSYCGKTMDGCIVSDKKDSSKYIFLPAAAGGGRYGYLEDKPGNYVFINLGKSSNRYSTTYYYANLYSTGYYNTYCGVANANASSGPATVRPVSQ